MKVCSDQPLDRIFYVGYDDGTADVYLRDNIQSVEVKSEESTYEQWVADEVHIKTTLAYEEIEPNFDSLWVRAETAAKTLEQRTDENTAAIDEIINYILEVKS